MSEPQSKWHREKGCNVALQNGTIQTFSLCIFSFIPTAEQLARVTSKLLILVVLYHFAVYTSTRCNNPIINKYVERCDADRVFCFLIIFILKCSSLRDSQLSRLISLATLKYLLNIFLIYYYSVTNTHQYRKCIFTIKKSDVSFIWSIRNILCRLWEVIRRVSISLRTGLWFCVIW